MTLDYLSVVSDETDRIVNAYESDPSAAVPWSDRWTVGTVARHVSGTHHVVAEIVRGRPDKDFGVYNELKTPPKDSPEFVEWFRSGTASLMHQLSSVPADAQCWSWYEHGRHVGWWARRMAFEAVIHRWDTDAARRQDFSVASDIAADGVDEFLDVFVAATRAARHSPPGPTICFECTDRSDRWWLDLSVQGGRVVSRDPLAESVRLRGTAEQLLLLVWNRVPTSDPAGADAIGDVVLADRWSELVPPM
jgi:uncharacterized protein (TIGR03083 family)